MYIAEVQLCNKIDGENIRTPIAIRTTFKELVKYISTEFKIEILKDDEEDLEIEGMDIKEEYPEVMKSIYEKVRPKLRCFCVCTLYVRKTDGNLLRPH
jgi:ATP-dependent helicase/DNAse subunit B